MFYVFLILFAILLCFLIRKTKVLKIGSLALITGGVKTGKSTLAVYTIKKKYFSALRQWRFRSKILIPFTNLFRKRCNRLPVPEKPLLYSNVPLNFKHWFRKVGFVPLTTDHLLRKTRFNFKSVIYIQEASLVADSQFFKNAEVNEQLLLFNKLIAHELHGGCLIYDTQSISDCHYAIKRCLSQYYYIHSGRRGLFFYHVKLREMLYSDDSSNLVNVSSTDSEDTMKKCWIPLSVWKSFDCYAYSGLTDDLEHDCKIVVPVGKKPNLKAYEIVSFKIFTKYYSRCLTNEKKND